MERPAEGPATGALFLLHGRGSWEGDLLPLADMLDPDHRLHVFAPRAPLTLEDAPGFHWYTVPRVGYPDPATFAAALRILIDFHDDQLERIAVDSSRVVLGGFSMGAVMSYALACSADRPRPAGVLGFSGFIPVLEDASWEPDFSGLGGLPVFIGHGEHDPVIDFGFAEIANSKLVRAGLDVETFSFAGGHEISDAELAAAAVWLEGALP
jgi:phospholipase/carboxylesterase